MTVVVPAGTGAPSYRFEVLRDDLGIPHVRADDELALAAGQGWVTARDRAWQIEVDRWRAEGRLAERVGPAGLDWDRFAHRVRLADTAQRAFAALDEADRRWVEAYVAGVNAGLERGRDVPEMHALADLPGALPPHEPWPAWMPLGVLHVAHVLFSGFPNVLWRDHVARTLGAAHPDRPLTVVVDLLAADGGPSSGSNAWALPGSRTASGRPLLAGDPHRLLELPGVYQQVRLVCGEYDVLGLAFPGVPGVPHFGHAGQAAWGITNAVAHHVEVFRERLRATGAGGVRVVEALGPDGWEPAASGRATVRVRGADAVEVPWVETARGVVVTGPDDLTAAGRADDVVHTVRIPARVTADLGVAAVRALLRVRSADDVAAAFDRWVDPVNRVLAADRAGRVLSRTAGRVPLREPEDRRLPLDGWSADARPAPWRTLPPPVEVTDLAVDANEQPVRPDVALGHEYAAPHRAHRVRALLDPVADLAVVHGWVTAPRAAFWGMAGLTPAEVGEIYAHVDALETHHAFLIRWDDAPVVLLQSYAPEHDPVGEAYPVLPGDVGMHLLLGGRGRPRVPFWPVVWPVVREHLLGPHGARRIVAEPDARNRQAVDRVVALGFELGPTARVGDKEARLAFFTRPTPATGTSPAT